MYEDTGVELKRILDLVSACPEPLQETAFAILLEGYVATLKPPPSHETALGQAPTPPHPPPADESWRQGIPEEVLPRFETMASRIKVSPERLADVFDFTSDPFTYAAVHVDGKSKSDRALRVALLVAARSYLATGRWSADWAEVKAMCTHQNCYDMKNFSATLRKAEGDWFKKVSPGASAQPSAKGQKEAEQLLAGLAGGGDVAQE